MTYTCTLKPSLYVKQKHWQTDFPIAKLPGWLDQQPDTVIQSGQVNLYVSNSVRDENGKIGLFAYLDIESPDHDDIAANINAAQDAYLWLQVHGLDGGLRVMCSGRGFRFCWPFIVPYEYKSAFQTIAHDIPYAEDIKLHHFLRLAGYRGNKSQAKKGQVVDGSIRLLSDPSDVMTMTVESYNALVSGSTAKAEAKNILDAILPNDSISVPWLIKLQEYQRLQKIKGCAIQPPRRELQGNYLPQIMSELEGRGITYREIKDGIYRLSECPICGRRDTNPFVTSAGRIKCWTVRCEAGQRDEQGKLVGLRPDQWIDNYIPMSDQDTQALAAEQKTTVDQSRDMIRRAVQSQHDVALKVTPGAGKTHTTLQNILPECQGKTIVYAEPTIAKAKELYEAAMAMPEASGINVGMIRGRSGGTAENDYEDRNCERWSEVRWVAKKGYSPAYIVCPGCPNFEKCKYKKQFEVLDRPGLVITTHEQSIHLPSAVDSIIYDENPENTLFKHETVSLDALKDYRTGGNTSVKAVFRKLDQLIEELSDQAAKDKTGLVMQHVATEQSQISIFDAAGITPDEIASLRDHVRQFQRRPEESEMKWQKRLYYADKNMRALTWLLISIDELRGRAAIKVTRTGKYILEYSIIRESDPDGRIMVLDGTAFIPALEALFSRRFSYVEASVDLSNIQTVHLKRGLGITKLRRIKQPEIERLLKKSVGELPPGAKRLLICTWKDAEQKVKAAADKVFPAYDVQTIHFMQTRGLNSYKDYDVAILFGTFMVNPLESGKRAELLFPNDFKLQNEYRLNLSESENLQSIHRVRPINGGKTLILYGKEWLSDIPGPDVMSDLRKGGDEAFEEAYCRARAFYQRHGFFYRHIAWALGIGHSNEKKQVEAMMKVRKNQLFCQIINSLYDKIAEKNRLLVLNDPGYYDRIINRLREDFPDAPELQTTQTGSGRAAVGIGRIRAVRDFFGKLGSLSQLDLEQWLEIPVAPPVHPKLELQPELATAGGGCE